MWRKERHSLDYSYYYISSFIGRAVWIYSEWFSPSRKRRKISDVITKFTWDNGKVICQDEDCIQQDWPKFLDPLHPASTRKCQKLSLETNQISLSYPAAKEHHQAHTIRKITKLQHQLISWIACCHLRSNAMSSCLTTPPKCKVIQWKYWSLFNPDKGAVTFFTQIWGHQNKVSFSRLSHQK